MCGFPVLALDCIWEALENATIMVFGSFLIIPLFIHSFFVVEDDAIPKWSSYPFKDLLLYFELKAKSILLITFLFFCSSSGDTFLRRWFDIFPHISGLLHILSFVEGFIGDR